MRKFLFAILVFGAVGCQNNEEPKDDNGLLSTDIVNNPHTATGVDKSAMKDQPTMDFKDTVHHFGTMRDGEVSTYEFEFTNNGKSPLVISHASGSCGCTVPDYPREPIAPGKSGILKVQFNSADKEGHVEKSVSVVTNSNRGTHMLYIKADVTKP